MRFHTNTPADARKLGVGFVAATLALPVLLGLLAPGKMDALVPVALMLPFLTMGVLEAAVRVAGDESPPESASANAADSHLPRRRRRV
jgi:hypothetical protein